jgi:hypothetical protein
MLNRLIRFFFPLLFVLSFVGACSAEDEAAPGAGGEDACAGPSPRAGCPCDRGADCGQGQCCFPSPSSGVARCLAVTAPAPAECRP